MAATVGGGGGEVVANTGPVTPSGGASSMGGTGGNALGGMPGTGGALGASGCPSYANFPASCSATVGKASLERVNTLLVVDKSSSMDEPPAGYTQDKWSFLTDALGTIVNNLQSRMAFGLEMFPAKAVSASCVFGCCDMPAQGTLDLPIPAAVPDFLDVLAQTVPGGGTPTAQALRSALSYFTEGPGNSLGGQKIVLLATDGGPNCNADFPDGCPITACTYNIEGRPALCTASFNCCDPVGVGQPTGCLDTAAVVSEIEALGRAGIPTIVLGLPGTEAYTGVLDQMALAGSLPNPKAPPSYYAVNAADGVQGLINTINQVMTPFIGRCDVQLDQPLPDPDQVDVAVDCTVLRRSSSDGGAGDWYLALGTNPPTVMLEGALCDRIMTGAAMRIEVLLGCPGYGG
jgi:hypothetical protein